MEDKKVTDLVEKTTIGNSWLMHIIDPDDLSQSVDGSSYKTTKQSFLKEIQAKVDSLPVDAHVVNNITTTTDISSIGGNIFAYVGEGTYTGWGGMVVPANNIGILSKVDDVFGVSLVPVGADFATKDEVSIKANLEVGKNRFNKNDTANLVGKFIDSSNNISDNVDSAVTHYIPIKAGETMYCNNAWYLTVGMQPRNELTDVNKENPVYIPTDSNKKVTATIDGFVRFSLYLYPSSTKNLANTQVELNSETTYENYYLGVPSSELGNSVLKSKVKNSLSSTDATEVLSAPKGKELNDRLNIIEVGKNRFNKNDITNLVGKWITDINTIEDNGDSVVTHYIPIKAGETMYCNNAWYLTVGAQPRHELTDINKENPVYIASDANKKVTATVDGFVRFSLYLYPSATKNLNTTQVELNSETTYEPYSLSDRFSDLKSKTNSILPNPYKNIIYSSIGDSIEADGRTQTQIVNTLEIGTLQNLAVGGSTLVAGTSSSGVLTYLNVNSEAKLITCNFGTNDWASGQNLGTEASTSEYSFYGALKIVTEGLIANHPLARIFFYTIQHRDSTVGGFQPSGIGANGNGDTMEDFNNAIKIMCRKASIPVIDLFQDWGVSNGNLDYFTDDRLHPNLAGHLRRSKVIIEKIKQYGL